MAGRPQKVCIYEARPGGCRRYFLNKKKLFLLNIENTFSDNCVRYNYNRITYVPVRHREKRKRIIFLVKSFFFFFRTVVLSESV
jgi:Fe-S-cluster containining protein